MQVNGQQLGKENLDAIFEKMTGLQGKADVQAFAEQEEKKKVNNFVLTECNRIADIPGRYSDCLLGQYQYTSVRGEDIGEYVKQFAYEPSDKTVLICGPTGVGKTSLMCAALHERAIKELPAGLYFNNRFLMPKLRTCRSFSAKENEEYFLRRLSSVPFLCIDEVGASSNMKEEQEFMTFIICARYDNKLPTFICTNLDSHNFSIFISGIDYTQLDATQKEKVYKRVMETNATLDRFNSTAKIFGLVSESHRG